MVDDTITRAELELNAYYLDRGYVNVRIGKTVPTTGRGTIVFTIVEGDRYRIGTLSVPKVPARDAAAYLKAIGVNTGDVFSQRALREGLARMTAMLHAAGRPDAGVSPLTNVNAARKTIDLTFSIDP